MLMQPSRVVFLAKRRPSSVVAIVAIRSSIVVDIVCLGPSKMVGSATALRILRLLIRGLAIGPNLGAHGRAMAKIAKGRIAKNNAFRFRQIGERYCRERRFSSLLEHESNFRLLDSGAQHTHRRPIFCNIAPLAVF